MNIVDLILMGVLVLGAIGGYQKGFVGSIIGLAGSILGLVIAYNYYPLLTDWFNSQFQVQDKLLEFFKTHLVLPQAVSQFKIPAFPFADISKYLDNLDFAVSLKNQVLVFLQKLESGLVSYTQAALADVLHQVLTKFILNSLSFVLIWIVVERSFSLLHLLYSRFIRNTLLGTYDRLAGSLLGLFVSVLALSILFGLMTPLLKLAVIAEPSLFAAVMRTIGEAQLAPYLQSFFTFLTDQVINLLPLS